MKFGKPERPCMKKQVKGWLDSARDDLVLPHLPDLRVFKVRVKKEGLLFVADGETCVPHYLVLI